MTAAPSSSRRGPSVMRLSEIEPIPVAGGLYHPVRRTLGVRAFGINAYSARSAGDPRAKEWAQTDRDFDAIRDDPRFAAATG